MVPGFWLMADDIPHQYFENAAAQEIFEFQVRLMRSSIPPRELRVSIVVPGLEYRKRGVKGVCKSVEQRDAPRGTFTFRLSA